MLKIGITGQNGFIGQHLYNSAKLIPGEFEIVEFNRDFFCNESHLNEFVSKCDAIVHLAALNRHDDSDVIYQTNLDLVNKLVTALKVTGSRAHVFFSSSSQEVRDNTYGKSKKEGREILAHWAQNSEGKFTGLIIPNVFGPFGQPNYNSFIATFCHQLIHDEKPRIDSDGIVKLIYVGDLVQLILDKIRTGSQLEHYVIPHSSEKTVSEILGLLESYKAQYFETGIIPKLDTSFEINLFNTFRSFINIKNHFPLKFTKNTDNRGAFVEIIRLNTGGQVSFSTTVSGITRGNHYHTRKIERFAVIKGEALIQLRKIGTKEILDFNLTGNDPSYVDMPVWYTHNIKNTGDEELYTIFWINEFYNPDDPDTYFENV